MVESQLIPRGISDQKVLQAFLKVPRHLFVPEEKQGSAYADYPLPIGEGQTISQPYIVALMTELLGLSGKERVLEIGTGSGYQTAILAELALEVYTVERFQGLADRAKMILDALEYRNIWFLAADGTKGWKEHAPYDAVIVTAAGSVIPQPLVDQLKDRGKIVLPLGSFHQVLTVGEKKGNELITQPVCDCVFVPLVGKYAK